MRYTRNMARERHRTAEAVGAGELARRMDVHAEALRQLLDKSRALHLAHPGEWVALADGHVFAHDRDLKIVLADAGRRRLERWEFATYYFKAPGSPIDIW